MDVVETECIILNQPQEEEEDVRDTAQTTTTTTTTSSPTRPIRPTVPVESFLPADPDRPTKPLPPGFQLDGTTTTPPTRTPPTIGGGENSITNWNGDDFESVPRHFIKPTKTKSGRFYSGRMPRNAVKKRRRKRWIRKRRPSKQSGRVSKTIIN